MGDQSPKAQILGGRAAVPAQRQRELASLGSRVPLGIAISAPRLLRAWARSRLRSRRWSKPWSVSRCRCRRRRKCSGCRCRSGRRSAYTRCCRCRRSRCRRCSAGTHGAVEDFHGVQRCDAAAIIAAPEPDVVSAIRISWEVAPRSAEWQTK